MMGYTALYWLALHLAGGHAAVLSAVVAAESLPMLLFSRRAGPSWAGTGQSRW
jgi:hypothetical protein